MPGRFWGMQPEYPNFMEKWPSRNSSPSCRTWWARGWEEREAERRPWNLELALTSVLNIFTSMDDASANFTKERKTSNKALELVDSEPTKVVGARTQFRKKVVSWQKSEGQSHFIRCHKKGSSKSRYDHFLFEKLSSLIYENGLLINKPQKQQVEG